MPGCLTNLSRLAIALETKRGVGGLRSAVTLRRRDRGLRTRRPTTGMAAVRDRALAIFAVISLVAQLLVIPYHQALAIGATPADAATAAELRAIFGDAAALCVKGDRERTPVSPVGDCDDHCPFCRVAAHTASLTAPPDGPALPAPLEASRASVILAPQTGAFATCPTKRSRARAPPFAI